MGSPTTPIQDAANGPVATPQQGKADDLIGFVRRKVRYDSILRIRRAAKHTRASLYRQAEQWLIRSAVTDPSRTPFWTGLEYGEDDDDAIPTPVQPEIVVHLQNESARLGKPEYKPYVRAGGENPTAKDRTGAKLATRALQARLKAMNYGEVEAEGMMHMPLWGQWILKSYWEESSLRTITNPSPDAMCCPRHKGAIGQAQPTEDQGAPALADNVSHAAPPMAAETGPESAEVPQEVGPTGEATESPEEAAAESCTFCLTKSHVPPNVASGLDPALINTRPGKDDRGMDTLLSHVTQCPQCPDHPDLVTMGPTMEEAESAVDTFGRPLGVQVPIGDWKLKTVSPYDWFPASQGVGMKWDQQPYWLEVYPAPLSWVVSSFKGGDKVKAEAPQAIAQWHPIAGERTVYVGGLFGDSVFEDFVRVFEYHEKPSAKFPDGRSIIVAGTEVLLDGPFMMPSQTAPGQKFPRVHYDTAVWEPLPHQMWGMSMSELLFSLQDTINETRSMEEDNRTRMGMMGIIATRGADLQSRSWSDGGAAGKLYEYDPDPLNPNREPKPFLGLAMPGWDKIIELAREAMDRIAGTNEIEGGGPPPGVTAALAMQILAEKSSERREPRIRRIREMLERVYAHGLTLMYHRYLEHRRMEFEDDDKQWKERAFKGIEINGQTRVRIDVEPAHDTKMQEQQRIQDAITNLPGMYNLQDPAVADRIAEKLGLPRDIGSTRGMQRENASRELCDYRDTGKAPVIDPGLDDHQAHYDQHGLDFAAEEWLDLEREAGWDDALLALWGWEQMWNPPPPPVMVDPVTQLPLPMPPQPPSLLMQVQGLFPQTFALELQLFQGFKLLLAQRGWSPQTPEQAQALDIVLRMRAHNEGHKMLAQGAITQAHSGAPVIAAPESDMATAQGTIATNAAPPEQLAMARAGMPAGAM